MTETKTTTSLEAAYQAAHSQAVVVDRSRLGWLKITGSSRLDLIDRMSTQRVKQLRPGEGAATILTTDIARTFARLILYAGSESVHALTGEDHAGAVARYLLRFVFFNDDFHLEELSAQTAVLAVYGAQAQAMLAPLFGPQAVDLPRHHWREVSLAGQAATLHRTDPVAGDGYFLVGPARSKEGLWQAVVDAGIFPAGEAAFEYLRIESALPRFGHELTLDYIPLETGLWADVSFNKGCYIGQEIIARMESRGRLAKKLVRLHLESAVPPGTEVRAGGRRVGVVTSTADGPQGVLALAYIKTTALEEQESLRAGDVPATLAEGA